MNKGNRNASNPQSRSRSPNQPARNATSRPPPSKKPSPTNVNVTQESEANSSQRSDGATAQARSSSSPIIISRQEILKPRTSPWPTTIPRGEQRRPTPKEVQAQFVRKNSPTESPTHSASPTSSSSMSRRQPKQRKSQPAITIRVSPQNRVSPTHQAAELRRRLSSPEVQRTVTTQKTEPSSRQCTPPPSPPSETSVPNMSNLASSLKNSHYMQSTRSLLKTTSATQEESEETVRAIREVQLKDSSTSRKVAEFVQLCLRRPIEEIVDEFAQLQGVVPMNKECAAYLQEPNSKKNRYKDIRCLEATRVRLRVKGSDYIHANFVTARSLRNRFIITQGPLSKTADDFWRMVWQEKCVLIYMLCNNIEEGRKKCHDYLPGINEEKHLDGILIRTAGITRHKRDTLIETRLELIGDSRTLNITHWKWIGWQDFKVPLHDFQTPLRLLRMAREAKGCTVVHCSAGVGRSGTLVALEMCLMELVSGRTLSVKECVKQLRHQRAHCVQTAPQYLFIYRALLEFALNNNIVRPEQIEPFHQAYLQFIKRSYAM